MDQRDNLGLLIKEGQCIDLLNFVDPLLAFNLLLNLNDVNSLEVFLLLKLTHQKVA